MSSLARGRRFKGYVLLRQFLISKVLVKVIAPDLKAYAYSVCSDHHLAEDLSQEVLAKVLESKVAPSNPKELKPYAFRMLRNLYIDYIRKQSLRTEYLATQRHLEAKYQINNCALIDEYLVNQAFSSLNEQQREIIYLVDILGYKYREVAEVTGLPTGTVMSRLNRARAAMLTHIQTDQINTP